MSKHTPGPWEVTKFIPPNTDDNDYPGAEISWFEVAPDAKQLDGHQHYGAVQIWSDRAEANARLIAAAPELLAACKAMVKATDVADQKEALDYLYAVIDKAEGR